MNTREIITRMQKLNIQLDDILVIYYPKGDKAQAQKVEKAIYEARVHFTRWHPLRKVPILIVQDNISIDTKKSDNQKKGARNEDNNVYNA